MADDNILGEVLEVVRELATHMDERFDRLEQRIVNVETTMATKEYVDQRFNRIEATMVTKNYLDDKLADTKGDLL